MIFKGEEVYFSAIPDDLLIATENVSDKALRETLGDILRQFAKQTTKVGAERHFHDEGFYPLTWASKRLGKDTDTISRRLRKLAADNVLTTSKGSKGYKVNDTYFRHSTTYIKLKPVSAWGQKELKN